MGKKGREGDRFFLEEKAVPLALLSEKELSQRKGVITPPSSYPGNASVRANIAGCKHLPRGCYLTSLPEGGGLERSDKTEGVITHRKR